MRFTDATNIPEDFDPEYDTFEPDFPEDFDFDYYRDEKLREHEDWFRGER